MAKREWEYLYVQHIQAEIVRLKQEHKLKAKRKRKRKILDRHATKIQTLVRGIIVRNEYRQSDKQVRGAIAGLSLLESVRKRMEMRKKIENLKKQISEVREARNRDDTTEENDSEVSVRKVEELKATQHKLHIKAKTLEAITRPLQEKFDDLRSEQEKLRKKFGKIESKNESRRYANDTKSELLAQKQKVLQETRDELLSEEMDRISRERSKAQQRLDTLVETSSAYASLGGMSERDASAFADEVARIGKEAHRKAKLFRDSHRSQLALSLGSHHSIDTAAAQVVLQPPRRSGSSSSLLSDDGAVSPKSRDRGHGRALRAMLRDRSEKNRSLSPLRQNGSFNSSSSSSEESRRQLKGQRYLVKRSLSPKRENFLLKREHNKREVSPQRNESVFIKRDRNRTPSPTKSNGGSANNTPVISNKLKFKGTTTVTPKANDTNKVGGSTATPKVSSSTPKSNSNSNNQTPKISNTHTPKICNKQTPKTTNVTDTNSKPMRRTYSEVNTSVLEMKRGLCKVLSERMMVSLDDDIPASPPGNRLNKLKDELRKDLQRKNLRKDSKGGRSKSRDRNEPKKPKSKKKEKSKQSNKRSNSPSRSNSQSHSNDRGINRSDSNSRSNSRSNSNGRGVRRSSNSRSNSRSRNDRSNSKSRSRSNRDEEPRRTVDRQFSGTGGLLRGKRPSNIQKAEDEDLPSQPRRHVSLTGSKIEAAFRKNKRSHLRKVASLKAPRTGETW